ncbi:MAG: hypothetical protein ABEH35_06570 [Haloarculaceae archaeon]
MADESETEGDDRTLPHLLPDDPSLLSWALGSFHAAVLVTVAVAALHWSGTLGDLLSGLNTAVGLVAYAILWGATWFGTRWALGDETLERLAAGDVWFPVRRGMLGGAAVGGGLVIGGGVLAGLAAVVVNPPAVVAVLIFLGVGGLVALAVGAAVGGLFAGLDAVLFGLARRVSADDRAP